VKRRVAVVGAGPAGAFIAGAFAERGFSVHLIDRRENPWEERGEGRSIALSLAPRGLTAIESVGLRREIEERSLELVGRAFHAPEGDVRLLAAPHGSVRNRSIARSALTKTLCGWALEHPNVTARFGSTCIEVVRSQRAIALRNAYGAVSLEAFDLVIGADGSASEVRSAIVRAPSVDFGKRSSPWGYLELTVEPGRAPFAFEPHAIHIWPRRSFFMVGFPAFDGSYKCTLVMRHDAHQELQASGMLEGLFASTLEDAWPRVVDPAARLRARLASIPIVRVGDWHDGDFMAILGDAAHATPPFMGQGVNIALEDAQALVRAFDEHGLSARAAFRAFAEERVPNGLACCDLSERAAHYLLQMPPKRPVPSPLAALNVEGRSYEDVARTFIPGWQPRVYGDATPAEDDAVEVVPQEILEPFEFEEGSTLMREGETAKDLLYVQTGAVRIFNAKLGEVRLRAPVILGEVGWFGGAVRTASAVAETPCRGGRASYARLDAFCASEPARAVRLVKHLGSLSVERLKDHFHPRAAYVVIAAYGDLHDALESWALSCREHLAGVPIACTAEVGEILTRVANVQPARVIPPVARGGFAHLRALLESAQALCWFRVEALPPELRQVADARRTPVLRDLEGARDYFAELHRAEGEAAEE
jgi:kynurenine 3-monooxygenase